MSQARMILGPERRRKWTDEQKMALLSAAFSPGGNVAEVARDADVCTSLLYRWRQAHLASRAAPAVGFSPAVLIDDMGGARAPSADAAITVEFASGSRVRIGAAAPAGLVTATLRALR
jgi:transposase